MDDSAPVAPEPEARRRKPAFAISFFAVLATVMMAGVVLPDLGDEAARRRDQRRLADIEVAHHAIEAYWRHHGRLPDCQADREDADTSLDHAFLEPLIEQGYLERTLVDPRNGESYHYCYRRLSNERGDRYLLGVRGLETGSELRPALTDGRRVVTETGDLDYAVVGPDRSGQ